MSTEDLRVSREPPYAERHVRWYERWGLKGPRLLDRMLDTVTNTYSIPWKLFNKRRCDCTSILTVSIDHLTTNVKNVFAGRPKQCLPF